MKLNPIHDKKPSILTEEYIRDNPIPVIAHPQHVHKHFHQEVSWCYIYGQNFISFLLGITVGWFLSQFHVI